MEDRREKIIKVFLFVLVVIVVGNLAVLDYKVLNEKENKKDLFVRADITSPVLESDRVCPGSCLEKINQATSSMIFTVTPVIQEKIITQNSDEIKEFFVPLGSGETFSDDWTDVPGISAYIDSNNYKNIKSTTFEASVYNPSGAQKVYVRLYNVTDDHPVWYSEMWMDGSSAQLLVSPAITLDKGNKLYKVQVKASLRALAKLNQSRVHILIK